MKRTDDERFGNMLQKVPNGTIAVITHTCANGEPLFTFQPFSGQMKGKGKLERFHLYPGLELTFFLFAADEAAFHHDANRSVLEINYCQAGRVGWDMKDNISIYLGAGDTALHTLECCAGSTMTFPLGYYQGLSVAIDFTQFPQNIPESLREAGIDFRKLFSNYCEDGKPITLAACPETDCIFLPLSDLPEKLKLPYGKLKAQELLLYLSHAEISDESERNQYPSQQVESVKEIWEYLTQHLEKRPTIEELARQYLINTTSLKSIFKAVYGMPLATYMKDYRMKQAARLLRETEDSIAEIAGMVGYESQGKFTQAFKDIMGFLPTVYRRNASRHK